MDDHPLQQRQQNSWFPADGTLTTVPMFESKDAAMPRIGTDTTLDEFFSPYSPFSYRIPQSREPLSNYSQLGYAGMPIAADLYNTGSLAAFTTETTVDPLRVLEPTPLDTFTATAAYDSKNDQWSNSMNGFDEPHLSPTETEPELMFGRVCPPLSSCEDDAFLFRYESNTDDDDVMGRKDSVISSPPIQLTIAKSSDRRDRYRQKNRAAAAKCRAKKKSDVASLEETHRNMSAVHKTLKRSEYSLRDELSYWRTQALLHSFCECENIQSYNARKVAENIGGLGPDGSRRGSTVKIEAPSQNDCESPNTESVVAVQTPSVPGASVEVQNSVAISSRPSNDGMAD